MSAAAVSSRPNIQELVLKMARNAVSTSEKSSHLYCSEYGARIPSDEEFIAMQKDPKVPSFKKIFFIDQRIQELVLKAIRDKSTGIPAEFPKLVALKGIDPSQTKRIERIWEFSKQIYGQRLTIQPVEASLQSRSGSDENSGVYYLVNERKEKVAVFKIGSQRACMETVSGTLAYALGFEDHIADSMFGVLTNAPLAGDGILEERLWNGKLKCHEDSPKKIVGCIEPYLTDAKVNDEQLSFTKMVVLALALGLRDGKLDSFTKGSFQLFDFDQTFPRRLDPVPFASIDAFATAYNVEKRISAEMISKQLEKQPPTTHLPLLTYLVKQGGWEGFLADIPLSSEQTKHLRDLVSKWNLDQIKEILQNQLIHFPDSVERPGGRERLLDDSGSDFSIEERGDSVDAVESVGESKDKVSVTDSKQGLTFNIEKETRSLKEQQIEATLLRLSRIKEFIEGNETISPIELVQHVDPYFALLLTVSATSKIKGLEQMCDGYDVDSVRHKYKFPASVSPTRFAAGLGRSNLKKMAFPIGLDDDTVTELGRACTPSSNHNPSPSPTSGSRHSASPMQRKASNSDIRSFSPYPPSSSSSSSSSLPLTRSSSAPIGRNEIQEQPEG